MRIAKDEPPMLIGASHPTGDGLEFDDILASMGVTDDILDGMDDENSDVKLEDQPVKKQASIIPNTLKKQKSED